MGLRIYLAGASAEVELCERYRDRLRAAGVEVAHDWMSGVRANHRRHDRALPDKERRRIAARNANAVASADVFWILVPQTPTIGAWVELGIAFGSARPAIIVSGPWRSIFADLADQFSEHEHAFDHIVDLAEIVSVRNARAKGSPGHPAPAGPQ